MKKFDLDTLDKESCRELMRKIIQAQENNRDAITFSGFRFKRKRSIVIVNPDKSGSVAKYN